MDDVRMSSSLSENFFWFLDRTKYWTTFPIILNMASFSLHFAKLYIIGISGRFREMDLINIFHFGDSPSQVAVENQSPKIRSMGYFGEILDDVFNFTWSYLKFLKCRKLGIGRMNAPNSVARVCQVSKRDDKFELLWNFKTTMDAPVTEELASMSHSFITIFIFSNCVIFYPRLFRLHIIHYSTNRTLLCSCT